MAYVEKTTTSYGSHVSSSFKAIGGGIVLFILATIFLFWNEGRAVKTADSIDEAASQVILVDDVSVINPEYNAKLIHATDMALTDDILNDQMFGVSENAIALRRRISYYQWEERVKTETKDKIGGGSETTKTYTYALNWTNSPVNSREFSDPDYVEQNFVLVDLEEKNQIADNVTFGAYKLPSFIKSSISGSHEVEINMTDEQIEEWNNVLYLSSRTDSFKAKVFEADVTDETNITDEIDQTDRAVEDVDENEEKNIESVEVVKNIVGTSKKDLVHIRGNEIYFGYSPNSPNVGDVKIIIEKVVPSQISIIAKVFDDTFEPYVAKNGKSFSAVMMGKVSAEKMFEDAHSTNSIFTWVFRILGIFVVIASLKMMFGFFATLLKVLPFLSNIAGAGIGIVCFIFGFAWSLVIIAIAWFVYRPLLGILLIALAIGGIVLLKRISSKKKLAK